MYSELRHSRAAGLALISFAAAALAADWLTTYTALSTPGHVFSEKTPAVAALIASQGLIPGLLVSLLLRLVVFGVVALVAARVPRLVAVPLLTVGVLGAGWTWWIALGNVLTIAHTGS
jgi:hypothetical protein